MSRGSRTTKCRKSGKNCLLSQPIHSGKKRIGTGCRKQSIAIGSGAVGEIVITDKQLNGFKIEHTGSAAKVSVKYIVEGGMV